MHKHFIMVNKIFFIGSSSYYSEMGPYRLLRRRHCLSSGHTVKINNKGKSVGVRENFGPKLGMPAFDRNKKTQQAS